MVTYVEFHLQKKVPRHLRLSNNGCGDSNVFVIGESALETYFMVIIYLFPIGHFTYTGSYAYIRTLYVCMCAEKKRQTY